MGLLTFTIEMLKDVPFYPTSDERLEDMLELADIKKSDISVDLGSGNGKIVLAFAKMGAKAYGIEIDSKLVDLSRINIKQSRLENRATILNANFFTEDLSEFNIVTVYGTKSIMGKLERKLKRELKPGTKVLLNHFKFPKWQPVGQKGEIYLYIKELELEY